MKTAHPRRFAVTAAVIALATALAGCASDSPEAEAPDGPVASGEFQFSWLANAQTAAYLVAEQKGYYLDNGIDLTIVPGGPNTQVAPQIASGALLAGSMAIEDLIDAVGQGADLVAIGAIYQEATAAMIGTSAHPLDTPADLEGIRLGVASADDPEIASFFAMNDIDPTAVELVVTGADVATVASGDVDAVAGTVPNQAVALEQQGIETSVLRWGDFGYVSWREVIVMSRETLESEDGPAIAAGILRGTAAGLDDVIADPDGSAALVVENYGEESGLDLAVQQASIAQWVTFLRTTSSGAEAITVTDEAVQEYQDFADSVGMDVDASALVDTSVARDAFGE